MIDTACEDRGADLFLLARGGPAEPHLADHLASCAGCRADLVRLRALAADLPAASEGLAPLPATRAAVLAAAAAPAPAAAPPPPPRARGSLLRLLAPAAAVAAGVGLTAFVLARGPAGPRVEGPVEVSAEWGGAALDGLLPGGGAEGGILSAREIAAVRIGPPVGASAVLGPGTRLRIPGRDGPPALELLQGTAWFDPAPRSTLRVRAGDLEVEGRGARFTIERRASGAAVVCLDAGGLVLRAGGAEVPVEGPARVDVPAGGAPAGPVPAAAEEAAAWFARPEVVLEALVPGEIDLLLRPGIPPSLRVAPFDPLDPPFSLRVERPGRPPRTIPVEARMLRRPAPPADTDGAFLLSPSRSYKITLDAGTLGLEPGACTLTAVYSARRGAGTWRGSRPSKPLEYEAR